MNEKRYPNVVRAISERPWAILPGKLEEIAELMRLKASGVDLTPAEIEARVANGAGAKASSRVRGIAVIPISGVISPRANLFSEFSGGTSIEALRNQFAEALGDEDVSAILFDVNSPGGAVDLVPEFAREVRAARGQKPIVAISNTLMASAAYYIGAQADEVFATPSGDTGSIGVFAVHDDYSKALEQDGVKVTLISAGKYKTEGNPYEPLGEEARGHIQELVDSSYEMFVEDVAAGRDVSVARVREGFGQGRVLHAKAALGEGLIDGVQTFEQTVRAMLASGGESAAASSSTLVGSFAGARGPEVRVISTKDGTSGTISFSSETLPSRDELIAAISAELDAGRSGSRRFTDEAEDARRAVAGVVTRLGSRAELGRGRLTAAKREALEDLRTELVELGEQIGEALEATAPAEGASEAPDVEGFDDVEAVLAASGARLRLTRGG